MSVLLSPTPWQKFFDNNGNPLANGQLLTLVSGTSTPQATWVDSTQTTQNPNPIVLDARGECNLWLDPTLVYKFVLSDSSGNFIKSQDVIQVFGPQTITQNVVGQALYPRTAGEISAGVTPTNYQYFPGNVLRYGSNLIPGTTDMTTAITNAIASNNYVWFPSGVYLVTSQINVNKSDITIEGENQNSNTGHASNGGVMLQMGPSANAAVLAWQGTTNPYQAINIRRIGIMLNNPGQSQIGIRISQALGVRISDCVIQGQGTANDDTTGVLLDGLVGPFGFTGDFDIEGCYINNHFRAINIQGTCTTVRVLNNEMNGTGNGGSNNSVCVNIGSGCNGVQVIGNTIEQWVFGLQVQGATTRSAFNYFESNTNNETWVHSSGPLLGTMLGNRYTNGPAPVYPTGSTDSMMVFSRNIAYVGGTYWESALGFREQGRAFNAGFFTTPTYAAGNFTASGSMTWTVGAGAVTTYEYTVVGKKMTVVWYISGGTAAGTASTNIRIAIPGSFVCATRAVNTCFVINNAVATVGMALADASSAIIQIYKDSSASTNYTVGGVQADTYGQISFEVQ